jgi:integrase
MEYIKSGPKDGLLFPELCPGPHGGLTGAYSKYYARFSDSVGITDPRTSYHSYRHSFKRACREAGISEEIHDYVTGHAGSGSVGRTYGSAPSLPVLAAAVASIKY